MKQTSNGYQGSELHRLTEMQNGYDEELFNRLYKVCRPVIRNLSKQVDCKRFNVTTDIIASYFWDKMLFVFNKYYGTCSEEHLKARILTALSTFKNKLLRSAYGDMAEYNQNLSKLEDLFDDSKEDTSPFEQEVEDETNRVNSELFNEIVTYFKENMSDDTFLVWEVTFNPPEFIKEKMKEGRDNRITSNILIEFFDLPKTKKSVRFIKECRDDITYWMDKAREELPEIHRLQATLENLQLSIASTLGK